MYVMLAPGQLKPGVSEAEMIAASDRFEANFVKKQKGVLRRHVLRAKSGGYADLVFFESKAAAERVLEAEMTSPDCAEFFSVFAPPDEGLPDMGVLSFEMLKIYEG
jgi:hypothetical protein